MKAPGGQTPLERTASLFFPDRCLLCGEPVRSGEFFCGGCGEKAVKDPVVRRFFLPEAGGKGFSVVSALPYGEGFERTLYRFKFRGYRGYASSIGRLMALAIWSTGISADGVTYVPLSPAGGKQRGYDQSRLLAKAVARALGLPLFSLLLKVRETQPQHQLPRRRRKQNVKNAYLAFPEAAGKRLILVDDIVTTGATLMECGGTLLRAGAREVVGLCAADAELGWREGLKESLT